VRATLVFSALAFGLASCGIVGSGGSGSGGSMSGGGASGPICGSGEIIGQPVPRVDGPGQCGIRRPVLIRSVNGVALTPGATVTCDTARALSAWVGSSAKPEVARAGERLASMSVAASYSCRTRNSRAGARMSEHGRGNAIDISALTFRDGGRASIAGDWNDPEFGPMLQAMHRGACGTFGTTLGPGSDGHHQDHVHYDVARHSNGSYCR
jgi:hypothetical protein